MSEITSAAPAATPSTPEANSQGNSTSSASAEPEMDLDNLTGAQASTVVKKAEAAGKSVKEYLEELRSERDKNPKPKKERSITTENNVPEFRRPKREVEEDPKETKQPKVVKEPEVKDEVKETKEEPSIKKYKVKVNGQEVEVDEKELLRGYSHRQAADKAFNEGKQAQRKVEQLINYMKNPETAFEILKKFGHDPQELSEKYILSKLEEDLLTPEQKQHRAERKELEQARKQLKALDDLKRQEQQAQENQRIERLANTMRENLESDFKSALEQTSLPINKHTIQKMATYIHNATQLKTPFKLTALEAAQLVKEDIRQSQLNLIGDLDGENLLKLLGDETIEKALKARGKKVANPTQSLRNPQKGNNDLLTQTRYVRDRKRIFDD